MVAALIVRDERILLDQRPPGGALGGLWEFPGGKVEPGESDAEALVRELREELGVAARILGPVSRVKHAYPDFDLEMELLEAELDGDPRPVEVAAVGWFRFSELAGLPMPPADQPLLPAIEVWLTRRSVVRGP